MQENRCEENQCNEPIKEKECEKCMLVMDFIERSCSSNVKLSFIHESMYLVYDCCGKDFETQFREFILNVLSIYKRSFLSASADILDDKKFQEGFKKATYVGKLLNFTSTDNFDIQSFFDDNNCDDDESTSE